MKRGWKIHLWSLTGKIIELVDVKNCYVWFPDVYWVEGKIYWETNVFPPAKNDWKNFIIPAGVYIYIAKMYTMLREKDVQTANIR